VLRRAAVAALMLFLLTAVTFVIWVKIPANPGRIFYGPGAHVSDEQLAKANHALGTDRPLHVQYGKYVWRLAHGDFGVSWATATTLPAGALSGVPARTLVLDAARVTGSLALGGAAFLLLLALPLGLLAAARESTIFDRLAIALSLVAISTHPIVVGLLLRIVSADHLHLTPPSGYCDLFPPHVQLSEAERLLGTHPCGGVLDWAHHLVLPWLTFALFLVAIYLRMIRGRMIEVLHEPFVRTARAKGASEARVLVRHGLRAAIAPVVTMLAMDVGMALGLAIYVETVFGLPGLGRLSLTALAGQSGYDRPVILGIVVVTGLAIVVCNLLADLVAAAIDPRVREAGGRRRLGREVHQTT
jgi:peptide/nickel transport system permease protein